MGMFDFPSVRLFCMAICRPEGCLIYNNRNVMVKKVKSLGGYRFFCYICMSLNLSQNKSIKHTK